LDEGVPAAVGFTFIRHGYTLIPFEDVLTRGSKDDMVCIAAEANDALLVAYDNDMKQLARQHGITAARFKRLNLLKFECAEPKAADRLEQAMSLLEHECSW
jgi:predicted nuclease of predicted toxin-antitoxin system